VAASTRNIREAKVFDNNNPHLSASELKYQAEVKVLKEYVKSMKGRWFAITAHPMVIDYLQDISIASSVFRGQPRLQLTHLRSMLNSHFGIGSSQFYVLSVANVGLVQMFATIIRMSAEKIWKIFTGKELYYGAFPHGLDAMLWDDVNRAFQDTFLVKKTKPNGLLFLPSQALKIPWTSYVNLLDKALTRCSQRGTLSRTSSSATLKLLL
jgi:hypothetical protein